MFRLARTGAFFVALFLPVAAYGQDRSPNVVRAEGLFDDARRLMANGDYAAACPKFADSQALDPAAGTVLNLAICFEKAGKYASAWATFRTAEALARLGAQVARADLAKSRAEKLQATLSSLTITVPYSSQVVGMEVRCGGEPLRPTEWGTPIPRDGGPYEIQALAPGKKPWTIQIELNTSGESLEINVPPLEDEPPPPAIAFPPPPALALKLDDALGSHSALGQIENTIAVANAMPTQEVSRGGSQRAVGLIIAGAGILTVGTSGFVGLLAKSKFNSALPESGTIRGYNDSVGATNTGNTATLVVGAGALATLVGAGIWLSAPKSAVVVGANGAGLQVRGGF